MTVHYPNGKKFVPTKTPNDSKPNRKIDFGNRGKTLEDELNETNEFYLSRNLAVIHKKPVPIQVVKVDYPSRSSAVIREAYYRTASTTDYNGVWMGRYIDFEAKETKNKTSFPLQNIHSHQMEHMENIVANQGIAFLLVRFSTLNRYFLLPYQVLKSCWEDMNKGARKSISLNIFEDKGFELIPKAFPRIDYLEALEKMVHQIQS
ncbi:Holliday junction resolvase RecU [Paenisporosarcina cavernae]|uniref:Holliday junction resolvase RecU n=1 Tax=Paenisporosarcina cavernae TaxID=2320858 RepID=A0A385YSY5_9BACL|nr:Holliday junction resolvase RecU [Paenisporosarcina cavernae]AYC29420.1 Holliday junction resolvase RecU [Paenisporosarcina cavernae]